MPLLGYLCQTCLSSHNSYGNPFNYICDANRVCLTKIFIHVHTRLTETQTSTINFLTWNQVSFSRYTLFALPVLRVFSVDFLKTRIGIWSQREVLQVFSREYDISVEYSQVLISPPGIVNLFRLQWIFCFLHPRYSDHLRVLCRWPGFMLTFTHRKIDKWQVGVGREGGYSYAEMFFHFIKETNISYLCWYI